MQNRQEIWGVRLTEKKSTPLAKENAVSHITRAVGICGVARQNLEWGFPFFDEQNGKHSHLSFSHTEDKFCALFSENFVGIDIENTQRDASRLESRLYTDVEKTWCTVSAITPIQIWCAKEAVLKSLGVGLRGGLKNIHLMPVDIKKGWFSVASKVISPMGTYPELHVQVELWQGYWIAIAAPEKTLQKGVKWLEMHSLQEPAPHVIEGSERNL